MKNIYYKKFDFIVKKIEEIEEISFVSKANSLNLLIKVDESVNIKKFKEILKEKSLRIVDLNKFTYNRFEKENYFIMGYANLSLDEISSGLDIVKYAIKNSKIN